MTRYEIAKKAYDRNEIGADTMAAMKSCNFSDESIKHKLAIGSIGLDLAGQLLICGLIVQRLDILTHFQKL